MSTDDNEDLLAFFTETMNEAVQSAEQQAEAPPPQQEEAKPQMTGDETTARYPEEDSRDEEQQEEPRPERDYDDDANLVYKKWFRTRERTGFLSIEAWWAKGKISIDIGETGSEGLKSSTKVWCDAQEFLAYLRSVHDGSAKDFYPKRPKAGAPTPESFVIYGGGEDKDRGGKTVSRILKIHYWKTGEDSYDETSFVAKAGHFEGRRSDSGAVIPDLKRPLSTNMIKVSRQEIHQIAINLEVKLIAAQTAKFMGTEL